MGKSLSLVQPVDSPSDPILKKYRYTTEEGDFLGYVAEHESRKLSTEDSTGKARVLKLPLYNRQHIEFAKRDGRSVVICVDEQEADSIHTAADIITSALPPNGKGRKRVWEREFTKALEGVDVVLLAGYDPELLTQFELGASYLHLLAKSVRLVRFSEKEQNARHFVFSNGENGVQALNDRIDGTELYKPEARPNQHSFDDLGNAERFSEYHRERALYCTDSKAAMVYDGQKWVDDEARARKLAADVVERIPKEQLIYRTDPERQEVQKHFNRSRSLSKINAMIELGKSYLEPVEQGSFDSRPTLLNVKNGTVDLESGEILPFNPEHRITRQAGFDYQPTADSSLIEESIFNLCNQDEETTAFLKRAFGSALTGISGDKAFFVFYGPPDTGKSTVLDAIGSVLGSYSHKVSKAFFTESRFGDQKLPPELSNFAGVRFAYGNEANQSGRFAVDQLMEFTGIEKLSVNPKYRRPFEFTPQFTLFISTNAMPQIMVTGNPLEAFLRRIKSIQCTHVVDRIDPRFHEKILSNPAGIGRFLIEGAREYLRDGLGSCRAVEEEVLRLREEADPLGSFIRECCEVGPEHFEGTSDLLNAFKRYHGSEVFHGQPLTDEFFSRLMKAQGYAKARRENRRGFAGLRIRK